MDILADENVPGVVVEAPRARGHDEIWIAEQAPSTGDPSVLALAQAGARLLVTHGKDFGALAFRTRIPAGAGIVLVRLPAPDPVELARELVSVIESRTDWTGRVWVIQAGRVRMRLLPK